MQKIRIMTENNEITYHKAQIIPCDPQTVVYWWEDTQGHEGDILEEDIPEGAFINEH